MIKILSAAEMREVDRLTTEKYGIPSIILMENAARAVADEVEKAIGGINGKSIRILCGRGNNGGDGAAVARLLWEKGARVTVCLAGTVEATRGDARTNFEICRAIARDQPDPPGGSFRFLEADPEKRSMEPGAISGNCDCVIDALFGTGLSKPLDGGYAKIVSGIVAGDPERGTDSPVYVSIDVPSGLAADSAVPIGAHARPDLTVTFTAPKLANVMPPAANINGRLVTADIGSPKMLLDDSPSRTFLAEEYDAREWLRKSRFADDSYKSKRGHALFVVGSRDYSGAAALAGNAAMRSGTGIVTVATCRSAQLAITEKMLEEVIIRGLPESADGKLSPGAFDEIYGLVGKADAIGIGCGLGIGENRDRLRRFIAERTTPMVVDADGLNALAPFDLDCGGRPEIVLTPHEGEFQRLLGSDDRRPIDDRIESVRSFAVRHGVILLLKGERVLIGEPSGRVVINPTGNPGLGKAGSGDTLTGIVTGFVAQASSLGVPVFETVVAATYIAGRAGDIARGRFGDRVMLACDVRDSLAAAFAEIETND